MKSVIPEGRKLRTTGQISSRRRAQMSDQQSEVLVNTFCVVAMLRGNDMDDEQRL
jgi:hypothetical protein